MICCWHLVLSHLTDFRQNSFYHFYSAVLTGFTNGIQSILNYIVPTFFPFGKLLAASCQKMTLIADNSSAEFSYFDEEANTQDLFPKVPEEITLFATFCCIIFIVLGIPGNLLTVVALARFQRVWDVFLLILSYLPESNTVV